MNGPMRLLFVGDVVGPTGCAAIQTYVPALRRELALDAVIANGENSANNGFGASARSAEALLAVVDFLTLGDHAFDQSDLAPMLDSNPRIIRPANFEGDRPGRGWSTFTAAGVTIGVANLLGKVFMRPAVTPTAAAADQAIQALRDAGASVILIDMQAEATSEKQGMGWYLAGRVSAVLGTHTHVPTADLRILPGGTAYVSDVGMTGGRDGVIGFDRAWLLRSMVTGERPGAPRPAERPMKLDAVLLEIDASTGQAVAAERVLREE
jgi:2',3'-cyclic-nucleotide 2'-phosphodiesterase